MTATKALSYCKVVSIGSFAGGSFGCGGNPSNVYEMFRVDCPELREAVAATASVGEYAKYTYLTKWEAEAAAVRQEYREERRAAERAEAERVAAVRRATGDQIREAMAAAGIDVSGGLRWSDRLIGGDRLTADCRDELGRMASGSSSDYDAQTYADGAIYRVRIGWHLAGGPRVVRLAIA